MKGRRLAALFFCRLPGLAGPPMAGAGEAYGTEAGPGFAILGPFAGFPMAGAGAGLGVVFRIKARLIIGGAVCGL